MEILKKNVFSIVCVVIALVAVIATFYPIGGMYQQLHDTANTHASMFSQLQGLLTKQRKLPLTDPAQTQQEDLKIFPNQKTIDLGEKVTKQVSDQSKSMVTKVVDLNHQGHALLVGDALPNPVSDSPRIRFGDVYKLVLSIDPEVSVNSKTRPQDAARLRDAHALNIRNDILNGGVPPTDQEITDAKAKLWSDVYAPRVITVNGQPVNLQDIQNDYNKEIANLPDVMKRNVATQKKIYVNPDALVMNPNVIGNNTPATVDIWFAQLALWIQQDVATSIHDVNANAKSIVDAPVKHLLKINIPPTAYVMQPSAGGAPPAPAGPADQADSQQLPKITAVSPTGRVSNPMYDVVQFTLQINVDASEIPAVIAALSQNKLISVYNLDIISVDSADRALQGFIYGPNPVVTLNLRCEALFMRSWTVPLMPDRVKQILGLMPPTTPGAPS
jgi:hypothetical protein